MLAQGPIPSNSPVQGNVIVANSGNYGRYKKKDEKNFYSNLFTFIIGTGT